MRRSGNIDDNQTTVPGHFPRIRALRFDDSQAECERRLQAFGLFAKTLETSDAAFTLRIARALRNERKAARAGSGYDPLRHLMLTRLARRLRQRGANKSLSRSL